MTVSLSVAGTASSAPHRVFFTRTALKSRAQTPAHHRRCPRRLAASLEDTSDDAATPTSPSSSSPSSSDALNPTRGKFSARLSTGGFRPADDATELLNTSAAEYVELKRWLLVTTAKYGAVLSAYCTLGYGLAPGVSAAAGVAGSVAYVYLLEEYVDTIQADTGAYTRNLVYEPVTSVMPLLTGAFGKVGAVYSRALLQKRLLVPVAMAATSSLWNALDGPFDLNYGAEFVGFLMYKAAVLTKLWESLKPDIIKTLSLSGDENDT